MHSLLRSLRHSVRLLLKTPGFTVTAVLILGFGIGANTAIFSLIDAVLLNPLPFPKADRLVEIFQSRTDNGLLDRSDWVDWIILITPIYVAVSRALRASQYSIGIIWISVVKGRQSDSLRFSLRP